MRIAVTYADGQVFQHFGHSEYFKIYDVYDGNIQCAQVFSTSGSGHEALAGILASQSVDVVICGGIGGGAMDALTNAGVEVMAGVSGDTDEAVRAYLAGELVSTGVNCNHHEHGEGGCHCGGHDDEGGCGCGGHEEHQGGGCHCGGGCGGGNPQDLILKQNHRSNIKKVIGVVSGKGGVGKSLVTSLLAAKVQKSGSQTAILDADVTGPSIPRMFGIKAPAGYSPEDDMLLPVASDKGTKVMSVNMILQEETQPVLWRGAIIAGTVAHFWNGVAWEDVDYMFVDMPPGTGDVPLTVFQSIPLDGIIVVASPQELVGMIVAKAVNMANAMGIPVLGLVENMSYFMCPNCNEKHFIYGESHIEELARQYMIPMTARIPIDPVLAGLCDKGEIENYECDCLDEIIEVIKNK